ncbi:MAG: DNA polymerase III subunit delta [Tannerellaceae bacterium]|jgi:DNA polymerase-3 subunit delta'|nr:DNA polymerase III subunit delta [Tannerellaceae bacterium]
MYFKDVIGQNDVKQRLIGAARKEFIPHAQLFSEAGGTGAFPLALAYSRYLNCKSPSETDACGNCPSCLKYDLLAHPDLHFVFPIISRKEKKKLVCDDYLPEWRAYLKDKPYFSMAGWLERIEAGNSQALIYSAESEEIMRKLSLRIYEANYRVLFVWLPEKMHNDCANKILKLVEEPSPHTLIFMVTEEPEAILGTILSRVQRINVRPIHSDDLTKNLIDKECLDAEAAREISHLAGGNYLKAKELINISEENNFFLEQFKEMMRNSWKRNVKDMKTFSDKLAGIGRERQKSFLAYCQRLVRENFMYCFQAQELNYMNRGEAEFSVKFAPFINERNVFSFVDELAKAEYHISQNVNAKMVFFDLALQVAVMIKTAR